MSSLPGLQRCLNNRPLGYLPNVLAMLLALGAGSGRAMAQAGTSCAQGVEIGHAFPSGATWSLCAEIDDDHGLEVSQVYYRAPGNFSRQVLQTAHVGQILLHYHDRRLPDAQIQAAQSLRDSVRDSHPIAMNTQNCSGDLVTTDASVNIPYVCARLKNNRTLAKYAQRPSLHSESWQLASAISRNSLIWTISINFTEDGQIEPAVTLSGRATRTGSDPRFSETLDPVADPLTRATLLSTWRLVFALDTDANDRVEQFEFPLRPDQGNRRPMQVTRIDTEALRQVHREHFRGWRVVDDNGSGYYLDPANSGFSYRNMQMNWAQFDLAVTRFRECERHALFNVYNEDAANHSTDACGRNLDEFVDGESMVDATAVIWYSLSRSFRPSLEDWPVISNVHLSFQLTPFDWTPSSPFEVFGEQ